MNILRRLIHKPVQPAGAQPAPDPDLINNYYLTGPPSPQNAVDIFKGAWSTSFPFPLQDIRAGTISLFEDSRIEWLMTELGDLHGMHILELGPLEGGHSYMLERSGAESITAIEANTTPISNA